MRLSNARQVSCAKFFSQPSQSGQSGADRLKTRPRVRDGRNYILNRANPDQEKWVSRFHPAQVYYR